ncbi:MAG: HEAT repeat domain-containing protein [Nitrososphaerales archaeon]
MNQLADESRPVRSIDLFPLSDVGRERLPHFMAAWGGLTAARRLELIRTLVEQAETNIHLNFHAILRSLLTDLDAEVRQLAIEGLWEDEKPSLIPPLISRLREDESIEVRASAATSLGRYVWLGVLEEIGPEPAWAAESALYETWFREGEVNAVRRRALEGLAHGSMPDLNELILNAYYDEDELMRQSALFAMGRTADSRWSRLVLSELASYEPAMRFEAAQAAGEMGLRPAVQLLIRNLDDPDESVREAAVAALGKIGGPAAKRALQVVAKSDDEALAQAAEDALAELTFGAAADENPLMALSERAPGPSRDADDLTFDDEAFEDAGFEDEGDEFADGDEAAGWDDESEDGEDDLDWDDEDEDGLAWDEDEDDDGDIDDLPDEEDDDL